MSAKRAGDQFTRSHHMSDEPSSKKPRFDPRFPSTLAPDAPDDDPVLELDEIGKTGQVKRGAVDIDGYDSDSSTENFDMRAKAKAKAAEATKDDDDSDEDMFAEDDKETKTDADDDEDFAKKKKAVRFLDVGEIQGQEETSKAGGHVSSDFRPGAAAHALDGESSSDSGDDEERDRLDSDLDSEVGAGGKKKHAPKLDAFNMKAEEQEGRFDEHGNYVRKAADPFAVHDSWLDGLSKKEIKKAKEAQEKRDAEQRKRDREDDAIMTSDILSMLIAHMEKGETVLESLGRLNKRRTPKAQKWQRKKKVDVTMEDSANIAEEEAAEVRRKAAVEAITGAADKLMTRGQTDIYEAEREVLQRQYANETGEDWEEPETGEAPTNDGAGSQQQWEFKWLEDESGQAHGPYDKPTMESWKEAGYFARGVEYRRIGDREWAREAEF